MLNQVTFQNNSVPKLERLGVRIVTLEMVDAAHRKQEGTSRRAFNRNRKHFIEGADFVKVSPEEFRALTKDIEKELVKFCAGLKDTRKKASTKITEDVTLLFESGYLMLTKSFRDDLSWQVQRQLVNSYFRRTHDLYGLTCVHVPTLEELDAMPVGEAQNLLVSIDKQSKSQHGQPGSSGMNLRKRELKSIRPAMKHTENRGQFALGWEDDKGIELTEGELYRQLEHGSSHKVTVGVSHA